MDSIRWTRLAPLALVGLLAACASSGGPPPPAPTVAEMPAAVVPPPAKSMLEPPASAVKAAENVTLTGTEMGTMWTFENPPLDYWKSTYGFQPSAEWLKHAQLASVRFGRGCSASFVSPDGLVLTNHHCARGCVDAVANEGEDFLVNGFYAATKADERVCPNLYLDQLIEIQDITSQIRAAAQPGMTDDQISQAQDAKGQELSSACEEQSGLQCQVVSLFHGGQYKMYKYKRYQPVKLVFAPELQTGFFGGDPDNFTYPRYDLDISFVRAYEPDGKTPASTPDYFKWDPQGAAEGELVFVTGNPGSTSRQITVSQYMYEREIWHPMLLDFFDQRLEIMHAIASADPARGREMQNQIFGYENTQKLYRGELKGLRDTLLLAKKIRWENEFRDQVLADPDLKTEYADVWTKLSGIQDEKAKLAPTIMIDNPSFLNPSAHLQLAGILVQYAREMAKPEADRSRQFQGPSLQRIQGMLESPGDLPMDQSVGMLSGRLMLAEKWLPQDAALVTVVQPGESFDAAARRLINGSHVGDAAFRDQLMKGGADAVDGSTDPLIVLAREMLDEREGAMQEWRNASAAEDVQNERFAQALFAVYGTNLPPDATFTLRITDGLVKRYNYNGTVAPPATTIYGLYARNAEFHDQMPWTLADSWKKALGKVKMDTPLDFVSTNDITGGNSGSPVIDRDAQLVGVAFDGNVESFPNEFLFAAVNGRTVAVHSAGIIEALRNVYMADALVKELVGTK